MVSADTARGLLLAALIVLSVVPAASAGPTESYAQESDTAADGIDDGLDPADEIYVRDNGDVVLVYNDTDETSSSGNVEYGADISSDLFYLLVTEPVEGETDVTGQGSLLVTGSDIAGDGQLSFEKPESLSSLDFRTAGETTSENAAANLSLDARFDAEDTADSEQFESASTAGNVTATASDFTANGEFDAQFDESLGGGESSSGSFVLTENDGSYTVNVERNETLSDFETEDWSTRARARETVEGQFSPTASEFNGSAEVTIDRYEYTEQERGARLDIAYTVEYTDVESAVTQAVAENITADEDIEMDSERAEELTTRMENLTVERISASYDVAERSASAEFAADIRNYDDVVLPALEIAEASDTETLDAEELETLRTLRTRVEAQQAADLQQRMTWSATVTKPSARQVAVTTEANYTTDNWDDYVSELNDRGLETYESRYEASATTTDNDRVKLTGSMTVELDPVERLASQMANASAESEGDREDLATLMRAQPERGKVNVSTDGETVRVEAATKFGNLAALRDSLAENGTVPPGMTSVVGRTDGDTTSTYVTVEGAVGEDASESDVRGLSYVDDGTEVHMPGQWDREFPSMDTERAASFLGVDDPSAGNATATSSGSGPGFGVGAALVALVGAALLARRRTQTRR